MFRNVAGLIGATGAWLLAFVILCALGTLGAIVTAPLAVIPLVGLVAILFITFPTFLLYVTGIFAIYCLVAYFLRPEGGSTPMKAQMAALGVSIIVVLSIGWYAAWSWNRAAGVDPASIATASEWVPLQLKPGGAVALVSKGDPYREPRCDAVCLSLLVTGRAASVIVALPERWPIQAVDRPKTRRFALVPDWRACFDKLRDYVMVVRQYPIDRRHHFRDFGLDPFFERDLAACLTASDAPLDPAVQPMLVAWDDEAPEDPRMENRAGLDRRSEGHSIVSAGKTYHRTARSGRRYSVPAVLSPYAGNAGYGGFFSLSWGLEYFETGGDPAGERVPFWSMLADNSRLTTEAMTILDDAIPATRRPDDPLPSAPPAPPTPR